MKNALLYVADKSMQLVSGVLFGALAAAAIIGTAARVHRDYKAGKLDD